MRKHKLTETYLIQKQNNENDGGPEGEIYFMLFLFYFIFFFVLFFLPGGRNLFVPS